MVERYRRGGKKEKLLGNHQKCWIWGRNTVTETLVAQRWTIHELHIADSLPGEQQEQLHELARQAETPVFVEPVSELKRLCHSGEHQGLIAKMAPFPYNEWDEILSLPTACPFYLVLDSIQDPFNLGAMIRSAEVLGATAIILGEQEQVGVTSLVARTSAGAVNHIPITRVNNLPDAVNQLKDRKVTIVAARETVETNPSQHNFKKPTALVIGNEGRGISEELIVLCDANIRIPQYGQVGSLNAAIAASILLYEAARQREENEKK
jgi:23S rRNA (guanosine2251-2'-O)-methyltransferase